MDTILRDKQLAFTLVELLITLGVFSILVLLALPSFTNIVMNKRMTAAANNLVASLNYARNFALNQEINVQVCPLNALNSTTCGGNWNSGWIIVSLPTAGTSTLLQSQQFSSTAPVLSSTSANIVFDPHGISTTQSNFKLCDSRGGSFAQSVEVLATGFVQAGSTAGQAVWDNSALSCP